MSALIVLKVKYKDQRKTTNDFEQARRELKEMVLKNFSAKPN